MPDSDELIPTSEAAELMGESVRQFIRRVERGTVTPALKLPGLRGAYMFNRADIDAMSSDSAGSARGEAGGSGSTSPVVVLPDPGGDGGSSVSAA